MASRRSFVLRPKPHIERHGEGARGLDVGAQDVGAPDSGDEDSLELRDKVQAFARGELGGRRLTSALTENELEKRMKEIWRHYRSSLEETGANTLFPGGGHAALPGGAALQQPSDRAAAAAAARDRAALGARGLRAPASRTTSRRSTRRCSRSCAASSRSTRAASTNCPRTTTATTCRRSSALPSRRRRPGRLRGAGRGLDRGVLVPEVPDVARPAGALGDAAREPGRLAPGRAFGLRVRAGGGVSSPREAGRGAVRSARRCAHSMPTALSSRRWRLRGRGGASCSKGPPGTGKSQTITNLIAQNLAEGGACSSSRRSARRSMSCATGSGALGSGRSVSSCIPTRPASATCSSSCARPPRSRAARSRTSGRASRSTSNASDLALNSYVHAVHDERSFGESVYRVTSELCGLREVPRIPLGAARERELDRPWVEERREAVQRLKVARERVGEVAGHLFAAVRRQEWRATLARRAGADAPAGAWSAWTRTGRPWSTSAAGSGWRRSFVTLRRAHELVALAQELIAGPGSREELFGAGQRWSELEEEARAAIAEGRAKDELHARVRGYLQDSALKLDLPALLAQCERAAGSFWPFSWFKGRGVKKVLRAAPREWGEAQELLSHRGRAREGRGAPGAASVRSHRASTPACRLFGKRRWASGDADWGALEAQVESAGSLRGCALRLVDGLDETAREEIRSRASLPWLATIGRASPRALPIGSCSSRSSRRGPTGTRPLRS